MPDAQPNGQPDRRPDDGGAPSIPFTFTANDLVGAIKQNLTDLHHYMSTPHLVLIEPAVCMAFLERAAQMVSHLPVPPKRDSKN